MLQLFLDPSTWLALLTLTALELVLGIDNIIFIAILVDRLPASVRERTRRIGLFLAMFMRLGLLAMLAWIVGMVAPLFHLGEHGVSGRDLILLGGGLFLCWKSTKEILELLRPHDEHAAQTKPVISLWVITLQIIVLDLVFSLDSIITAVGLVDHVTIMMAAVILSVALMMMFAGAIGAFVARYPRIKMLALAFLVLIGVVLIAEGVGAHVPKIAVYGALGFALAVELLNMRASTATPIAHRSHNLGKQKIED